MRPLRRLLKPSSHWLETNWARNVCRRDIHQRCWADCCFYCLCFCAAKFLISNIVILFFFFNFFFLWVITAWSADDWLQLGQWRRVKCDAMCGLWLIVESNWIELKWIESVGTEDLKDWRQMTRLVDWPLKLVQPTGNKMASSNKRATPVRRHFPFQSAIRYQRTNDTRAPPNSIRWQNNPIRVQFHSLLIQFHSIIVDAYLRFYLFRATFHLLFNSINPSHWVSIRHFIQIPLSWVEFNVELQVD